MTNTKTLKKTIARSLVLDKLYQLQNQVAIIPTRAMGRSVRDEVVEMIGATIRDLCGSNADPQNIGIVIKPPPPPPPAAPSSPEPEGDRFLAPTPVVFRDDDERSFWESTTLKLARTGDTTSQSVASAADELVEERRDRMPLVIRVRDELRDDAFFPVYDAFFLHGKVHVTIDGQTCEYDVENDERFKGKDATTIVRLIRCELKQRKNETQSAEPSDKLLLKAAAYANRVTNLSANSGDLSSARSAANGNCQISPNWTNTVRAYVVGALSK